MTHMNENELHPLVPLLGLNATQCGETLSRRLKKCGDKALQVE